MNESDVAIQILTRKAGDIIGKKEQSLKDEYFVNVGNSKFNLEENQLKVRVWKEVRSVIDDIVRELKKEN